MSTRFEEINLGEYVVTIDFNEKNSELEVTVYDAGGQVLDVILISDDEDGYTEPEDNNGINLN